MHRSEAEMTSAVSTLWDQQEQRDITKMSSKTGREGAGLMDLCTYMGESHGKQSWTCLGHIICIKKMKQFL